jgi:Transglycosylase SLT domain
VPPDGGKWGITKGSPEEWAKFGLAVAKQESGLNPRSQNLNDPGGSFGLYQFNQHQFGLHGNAFDPEASTNAFVASAEHYAMGKAGVGGMGATFGSIKRSGETLRHYGWAGGIASRAPAIGGGGVAPGAQDASGYGMLHDPARQWGGTSPDSTGVKIADGVGGLPGDMRGTVVGNAAARGANPTLIAAGMEASKYLPPGWRAEAYSGKRDASQGFHGSNEAVDWRLIDDKGHTAGNYQSPADFRTYEKFAQDSHAATERTNP